MKTSDIPGSTSSTAPKYGDERDAKTEDTKTDAAKAEDAKTAAPRHRGPLLRAAESSDPAVHKLLAERQAYVSNAGLENDPAVEANRKAALEKIDEVDKQLAELGFTAK